MQTDCLNKKHAFVTIINQPYKTYFNNTIAIIFWAFRRATLLAAMLGPFQVHSQMKKTMAHSSPCLSLFSEEGILGCGPVCQQGRLSTTIPNAHDTLLSNRLISTISDSK